MSAHDRIAARAAGLLARNGATLRETGPGCYALRTGPDLRRRPAMTLDDATFARLAAEPGLRPAPGGGWRLARGASQASSSASAGRPSMIDGRREVVGPDGRHVTLAANLGESPIAWLARRRDGAGRSWLTPPEVAAAEKLREDFVLAGTVGRLTMAWDAGPRARGGRGPGQEPAERARAAKDRIARALDAVGPGLREILEHVCFAGSALEAAERGLGLPRRSGKTVLKLALQRLAVHYGVG
ncbi:MAG: DUF6456 domain-containing protein [Caulobacter sp.]|nr:DUF6456 domain-containing protein [Caulobacter sp.]